MTSNKISGKPLVLIGDGPFAEIAYEYFTYDSDYEVIGFTVEREYLKRTSLLGLPVVPFEELDQHFAPKTHSFYAALVYTQGNKLRERLFSEAKAKGFLPASYVSSRAFVWRNVVLGEHCFIFENNVVQPFVTIGSNVILWSGNHIGHHSTIGDHCFVSSHVVVSGFVTVGASCFLGVNTSIANNTAVGSRCVVGAAATIVGDVPDDQTVVGLWKKPKDVPKT